MTIFQLNSEAGFSEFVNWRRYPDTGKLKSTATAYSSRSAVYDFNDFRVDITIRPTFRVRLSGRNLSNVALDFPQDPNDEFFLLGEKLPENQPIHLVFDRPVAAMGAFVSADTTIGQQYIRQLGVKLAGQQDWIEPILTLSKAISNVPNTATFLGAESDGPGIVEAWFDVDNVPGSTFPIRFVALGGLCVRL